MVKKIFTTFLALTLTFSVVVPNRVEASSISGDFGTNLSAHWTCDEASGTRYDSTSNNNDLTDNGGVASVTGALNDACDFNAGTNEYLSITDASQTGLDLSGDFSLSFWIDPVSDANNYEQLFVKDENGANNTRQYGIVYDDRNFAGYPRIGMELYPSGYSYPGYWAGRYTTTLSNSSWTHVLITCDISAANDSKCYLYLNGAGQGYFTLYDGTGATSIQDTASAFQIGYSAFNQEFEGYMDEISIWDGRIIASSTGEVTTLYNSGTPLDYAPTVIVEATSSTPFVNRGGSVRINGGSFRNTQK